MKNIYLLAFLYLFPLSTYAEVENTKSQQAIDWIMASCVSGGSKVTITSSANASISTGISVKSFLDGKLGGEVKFKKSEISGLTDKLNSLSFENAEKVRDCIAPYRSQILGLILGLPEKSSKPEERVKRLDGNFSLNLSSYQEGDIPTELGTDIVIEKAAGKNVLVGMTNNPGGSIKISDFVLKGNFNLEIKTASDEAVYILRSSDGNPEKDIAIKRSGHRLIFGNTNKDAMSSGYKRKSNSVQNSFIIYAQDNAVKLYVNDNYFGSIKHDPSTQYGKVIIKGIGKGESVSEVTGFNKE